MTDSQADTPRHLYDVVSDQRTAVVDGFADQRESLRRAVEDQRLAAMPEAMRRAALGPMGLVGAEIAQVLQHMIAREVTRQLDLAVRNMLAQAQADSAAAKPPAEKG